MPPAYVLAVIDKLNTLHLQSSFSKQLKNNFSFLLLGPFILILDLFADLFYFWKNNFRSADELKKIIMPAELSQITHQSIKDIINSN